MKKIFLLYLVLTPLYCFAQDLSGIWKGELLQDPNKKFYFEIRMDKVGEDGIVSGTTYIESYGSQLEQKGDFGTIEFTGSFGKNSFEFQESKVVREVRKSSSYYWCIKKGALSFKIEKNQLVIEGPWTAAGGCVPGTLRVTKEITMQQSAEYCIDDRIKEWSMQGKYESNIDFENRITQKNKELKIKEIKQRCVCDKIDWSSAMKTYDANGGYYQITMSDFTPFKIYVAKENVSSFDASFHQLILDSALCDIDYNNNQFKIDYMALKNSSTNTLFTTLPIELIIPPVKTLDTLEHRVVETKYKINVGSPNLTLEVWDNNLVDGDIISLNLNGEWILKNYTVKKAKRKMTITLTEKENLLILHAENLGSKPPNTAAINVNDGIKDQQIILNSDQGKSEAIKITLE